MTAVIETTQLTKSYGKFRGIVDVDLAVQQGEIFGFLGPNGAGKTTTIRILLDLIRPTSGEAKVFGVVSSADPVEIHRRLGYLPGEWNLYDRLTGAETIRYFGNLSGGVDQAYVDELVKRIVSDTDALPRSCPSSSKQTARGMTAPQNRRGLTTL